MKKARHIAILVLGLSLFGCGGGGGNSGGDATPITVTETLNGLGVSMDTTSRTYPDGTVIPDTDNPLRNKVVTPGVMKQELSLVGFGNFFQVLNDDLVVGPDPSDELYRGEGSEPAYTGIAGLRTRVGVAANTDGDANKEVLFVGVEGTVAYPFLTMIEVRNVGDGLDCVSNVCTETKYSNIAETPIGSSEVIGKLHDIAAGDIDNDGRDELVIVYHTESRAVLIVLDDRDTEYQKLDEISYPWDKIITPKMTLRVDMGNIDRDGNAEIAVLFSKTASSITVNYGTTAYFVYDYNGTALVETQTGLAEADTGGGVIKEIMFGDISLGDIDGDGLDEVVMAGVEKILTFTTGNANAPFLQIALDDAEHGFAQLAILENTQLVNDQVSEPYVETWDPDGDGIDSIQVHGFLYQDFVTSGGTWVKDPKAADLTTMLGLQASDGIEYKKSVAAMGVGDLDLDGRDELILSASNGTCINIIDYRPSTLSYQLRTIGELGRSCASGNNSNYGTQRINSLYPPVLLPVDFDGDALVLSYEERHDVVYSEPVIIAALAAAPCYSDPAIGQDTSACVTSFGLGKSTNVSQSTYASITVGGGLGFEAKVYSIGVEFDIDVTHSLNYSYAWDREVSQTITYTAGAMTDAVIFASLPYDRYFYTVLNDPYDSTNNGETLVVTFPRAPQTLLVSKDFYNDHTPANKPKLGTETFSHTVGNPKSYPTAATANTWLDDGIVFDNGLKSTMAVALSQTGSEELQLAESLSSNQGVGYDFSFTATMEISGGVTQKYSLGVGAGYEFGWGKSESTAVAGSVGAITDPTAFIANGYHWGIGLYPVRNNSGLDGEVIYPVVNYWVE